jgi:hypothetical protein
MMNPHQFKGDEVPQTQCPRCGNWQDDFDGFGVLYCQSCHYCAHPSVTDGQCDLCRKPITQENKCDD